MLRKSDAAKLRVTPVRRFQIIPAAAYVIEPANDLVGVVTVHGIVDRHLPAVFLYVKPLADHNISSHSTGSPALVIFAYHMHMTMPSGAS